MTEYTFQNRYGVITVNDRSRENEPKNIRFITSDYRPLFEIPDGEQIIISYKDGRKEAAVCNYLDEYHFRIGSRAYHICAFAEIMERIGANITPFPEKRYIWSNIDLDIKDWEADLREEYPDLEGDELYGKMLDINAEYLCDERVNLDVKVGDVIVKLGTVGRWNGTFSGYSIIESGNIKDCLYTDCDYAEWYVDRDGEFRSRQIHHDGTNNFYYRKFKDGVSDEERSDFLDMVYNGKATQDDIDKVTEKLGRCICDVYGWDYPTPKEQIKDKFSR